MKKALILGLLIIALIVLPLLTACEEAATPTPSATSPATATPTATVEANWWDKFGEPQYGDTITLRTTSLVNTFDMELIVAQISLFYWWEELFTYDRTVSPDVYDFKLGIIPDDCFQGLLAESWEMTGPTTLTVKIREGIYYENRAPVNGREFTAHDVQYHYDRELGTGSGFTELNPQWATVAAYLKQATATDDYTVVFEFVQPSAMNFNNLARGLGKIECRESVEASGGSITDWKLAIGTGPWTLTDYVSGSSMTYSKNPNYWGYDERHPENQLPYADAVKVLMIPEVSTAMAAIRTGQIDIMQGLDWRQAGNLEQTNPELEQFVTKSGGYSLEFRYDMAPFNDIRVRKAMQMAVNLEEIALSHYGGTVDPIPNGHISQYWEGYCFPYEEWPQSLKDEYSYNPEGAKQLLAEAAADGVFEVNEYGGFDTNILAPTNTDVELIEIMKGYFMEIGVDMEIKTMEYATWGGSVRQGLNDGLIMHAFANSGNTDVMAMADFAPGTTRNLGRIDEPQFQELYAEYAAATEFSELAPIFQRVDKLYLEKHPRVQTFNVNNYLFCQPYLKGYNGENSMTQLFPYGWHVARFWIDQDMK